MQKYTASSNPSEEEQAELKALEAILQKIERDYQFSFPGELEHSLQKLTGILDTLFLQPSPEEHKLTMKEAEALLVRAQAVMSATLKKL